MKSRRVLAKDIWVSNDTRETGLNNNDMIIGPACSGKTGGYVVPNLQNLTGSLILSDTKGLLWKKFREPLIEKGYQVAVIDFVNPENSIGYNPLKCIRKNADGTWCETDIKRLATTLMPKLDSSEPFWEKAGIRYITMLIGYVLEALPEEERTMGSVFNLMSCEKNKRDMLFTEWRIKNPNSFTTKCYNRIRATSSSERMWGSILEFCSEALDPFGYRELRQIFEQKECFDIESLGRQKTVLFLTTSDNDPTFHVLCDVFYTQAMNLLLDMADRTEDGRLPVPVRMILDDFGAASRIPNFENLISIIRSRDISVSIILQSYSQLINMYETANAETIMNNCDHILYLGGKDLRTASLIGNHANLTMNSVLTLPKDEAILITNGEKARTVKKMQPYSTLVK